MTIREPSHAMSTLRIRELVIIADFLKISRGADVTRSGSVLTETEKAVWLLKKYDLAAFRIP